MTGWHWLRQWESNWGVALKMHWQSQCRPGMPIESD
jgi:hypothetical protein